MDFLKFSSSEQLDIMVTALFPKFHENRNLRKLWNKIDILLVDVDAKPQHFSDLFGSAVAAVNPQDRMVCEYFRDGFATKPAETLNFFTGLLEKHSRYKAAQDKAANWKNYI